MANAAANVALLVSLLLLISLSDGRLHAHELVASKAPQALACEAIHGVRSGETCLSIQKEFDLTPDEFGAINPNLVCEKLFAGQWICLVGSA